MGVSGLVGLRGRLWVCTWVDEFGVFGGDVWLARHGAGFLVDGGCEGIGGVTVSEAVCEAVCVGFGVCERIAFGVAVGVRHLCRHIGGGGSWH